MNRTHAYTTTVEPAELGRHLDDPDWAIVDCRFELTRPEWGVSAYESGHIPRALYAHLDRDLSGPVSATTGRHPLPRPEVLAETFSRWGLDSTVQVVAYDQGNGAHAARLWWLLRWLGHTRVAVLNGGFAAWQQAGLPIELAAVERPARRFTPTASQTAMLTTAELERIVCNGELRRGEKVLVDARGAERFAGQNETIDPVAGHVPGARNHPFVRNLDAAGRFLPADELRRMWEPVLRDGQAGDIICMCGSGVTACHNLLALEIAGVPGARLYAGSWSEWIRDPSRPIAQDA